MVGPLDHVEVVFHHEHGVARVDEPLEHADELLHIVHVQAGGRLVEDVERAAGGPLGQLAGELHTLGLSAREGGRGLAEMQVVEADVAECAELAFDVVAVGKELAGLTDLHAEHVGNVAALPADLEGVFGEAAAAAGLAGDPHVGEEFHLQTHRAVALARFAAAAGDVEAEAARLPAPLPGFRQHGEEAADIVPDLHVGRGVGPRRAADRRLIDDDHLVDMLDPPECVVVAGLRGFAAQGEPHRRLEHIGHQRALAAARDAGHADQHPQRNVDIDLFEVVVPHAFQLELLAVACAPLRGHLNPLAAREVVAGDAAGALGDLLGLADGHHLAASLAGPGAEIDHPVGEANRLLIMLHDDDRVAFVAKLGEGPEQPGVVARMQADRGFVEHIEHAGEAGADLGGQPDPLALAA